MRLSVAVACLLLAGCAGPHASGGLWALQNLEQESVLSRRSEAQRAAQARAVELSLADEAVAAEWARIDAALQNCPGGTRQALQVSPGDRIRDAARVRIQDDQTRLAAVAQVALADWRVRRARATGEARFCDDARGALAGGLTQSPRGNLIESLGTATVSREPRAWVPTADTGQTAMSNYALGIVDIVTAPSPLPQYLAAVYGGVLVGRVAQASNTTADVLVDELAPAYPEWEPDALYAALGA